MKQKGSFALWAQHIKGTERNDILHRWKRPGHRKKIIKEENNKLRCFLLNEEVNNSIVYNNNNIFQLSTEVEGPVVDKESYVVFVLTIV